MQDTAQTGSEPGARPDPERRRAVRRSALLFGLIAFAFYATFIVYALLHGHR